MPQIAILPITSPVQPPSLPTGSSEPSSFSPHLKEAIQNVNDEIDKTSSEHVTKKSERATAATNPEHVDISQYRGVRDLGMSSEQQSEDILSQASHQLDSSLLNRGESIVTLLNTLAATNPSVQGESQLPEAASFVAQLVNNAGKGQLDPRGQSSPIQSTEAFQGLLKQPPQVIQMQTLQGLPIQTTQNPSGQDIATPASFPVSSVTNSNPLIKQLQSIIDGGEQGISLSIISSGKALRVSTNGGTITTRTDTLPQQSIMAAISLEDAGDSATLPSYGMLRLEGSSDQQQGPATSRQTLQQQYFEGKLTTETKNEGNSGTGDKQPQNGATTTQAGLAANNEAVTLPITETPTAFSHILAQSSSAYKPLGHESLQPVLLPSGNAVYQEEVIRNIAERFHIMRRDSDTRVNLQLHPAELGELRIDLSVKNGTVRANVVASTQIAQDIIEKNMPRLRSILEQQGFSIDEILVSNSSPAVDDFNLFDRQHYDDRDAHPSSSQRNDNATAVFTLDGQNSVQEESTGSVNVKI
jgi:flagellar hook-length control protein FliK